VGLPGHRGVRGCRPCAWPVFEVSGPLGPPSARKRAQDRLSRGLVPYDTSQQGGSGSPGASTPRHLPSSGFDHPLDGLLSAQPGDGPSTAAASMGFSLQGLAPPDRRHPSRGRASPVVFPVGPKAGRSRLQRLSPIGKGNDAPPPEGADRRTLPSWVFAPPRRSPPPRWNRLPGSGPSCPFGRKYSLRSTSGRGSRGYVAKAAGLSRDCRPSWGSAPSRSPCDFGQLVLRAHGFTSARWLEPA
jgi:hypothetical protein